VQPDRPPLVSVVIPTYNQASYLRASIDSVLAQTYPSIEVVVVDDGSTDETPEILDSYGGRVRAIRQTNHGAANALNHGIRESVGQYVCWLSSDDAFLPDKVARQVAALEADRELGLSFMGFDTIDSQGSFIADRSDIRWRHPDLFVSVFWANPINGSTVMMPRSVLDEAGPFDEALRADVDAEMWFRVLARHRAAHIPGVHLHYRVHDKALSADRSLMHQSKTTVRQRILRDGILVRRLQAHDPAATPRILAEMSATFTQQGLHDLGRALLVRSFRVGRAWDAQRQAAAKLLEVGLPKRLRRVRRPSARRAASRARRLAASRARRLAGVALRRWLRPR
jgi:glycosyltransferase involved in cell wall biosynthesis